MQEEREMKQDNWKKEESPVRVEKVGDRVIKITRGMHQEVRKEHSFPECFREEE